MTIENAHGRAIFVSQWFPPESAAQAARLALVMQKSGFKTSVVTGIPNYPTGEVFKGYRATQCLSETWYGLNVHRSPLYPSHDSSALPRIVNYVTWAVSATLFSVRHFLGARVALVYSSPATAALPAMVARRIFGVPYVLLIQDLWPDSVLSSRFLPERVEGIVARVLDVFVRASYRWAAEVVVISPGMVKILEERQVPTEKISLIYNAVDARSLLSQESPHSRESLEIPEDAFLVMYGGNHGAAQDLATAIRAVGMARADRPLHLLLVGSGVEKEGLRELAIQEAPGRVTFLEPVPREQMGSLMSLADVQLVSLAPDPLYDVTMPSKVQGVLALGHPVWAIASGDVADVVNRAAAGIVTPPQNVPSAVRGLEELARLHPRELRRMGRSGHSYYSGKMEASVVGRQMARVLERCARKVRLSTP